jgi:Arc/MetJ family transcription regulator
MGAGSVPRRDRRRIAGCAGELKLMLKCINTDDSEKPVRTTITIDDELYASALAVADPGLDKADLIREAVKVFVRVQAGKRLAALGGQAPAMRDIPRRRAATDRRR